MCYYPQAEAAAVDALRVVQERRRWIADDCLRDIAEELGMSEKALDAAATIYNRIYRTPVGRHVVLVCDGVSCWIMGGEAIAAYIVRRLGLRGLRETTADGMFTVLPASCLGACDHAPAMMVDGELYGDLTPEKIDRILDGFRRKATAQG